MARQSHIQFSIPEPCKVPWNSMSPVDADRRYCSSCEKVITDFSRMSDDELMLYFRHSKGNICGGLSPDQLNRPMKLLPEQTQKARWWRTLLLLPLTLFSKNVKAQNDSLTQNDSIRAITTQNDSVPGDEIISKTDSLVDDSTNIASHKPDTLQPEGKIKIELLDNPWITIEPQISLGCICTGPIPPEESNPYWIKFIDSLFPLGRKRTGDQLNQQGGLKQLADKPEEKPKPQEPALPASNDLNAILTEELRKSKRV